MSPPRIAIVGAGHLGRLHAKTVSQLVDAKLVAVVDPDEHSRITLAEKYGLRAASTVAEVIADIDAAIIAAPSPLHYDIGMSLLSAGIDLLIEKPLAMNSVDARALQGQAQRSGRILQVGHVERFNPAYLATQSLFGTPRFIECKRLGGYSFRSTDTGVVLDLMIHDLDLVVQIVKSPVAHLDAVGATLIGPHEDIAHATLYFENGCRAQLSASRVHPTPVRTLQSLGEDSSVHLDFAARSAQVIAPSLQLRNGQLNLRSPNPTEITRLKNTFFSTVLVHESVDVPACDPLTEEVRDFLRAIKSRTAPCVSGLDGLRAVELAESIAAAIHASSSEKRNASLFRAA